MLSLRKPQSYNEVNIHTKQGLEIGLNWERRRSETHRLAHIFKPNFNMQFQMDSEDLQAKSQSNSLAHKIVIMQVTTTLIQDQCFMQLYSHKSIPSIEAVQWQRCI